MLPLCALFFFALVFFVETITVQAATYYVATTGNDGNSCATAQNINTPKKTIRSGLNCPVAGDTLYIRAGTYPEAIDSNVDKIPAGTSWGAPVTIAGYPGEAVTLNPRGSAVFNLVHLYIQYLVFDNLHLDGTNLNRDTNSTNVVSIGWSQVFVNRIKIQNTEVKNSPWNGLLVAAGTDIHLINLDVHDNGWWTQQIGYGAGANGAYLTFSNSEVVGGRYHKNLAFGIRVFDSNTTGNAHDNVVKNTAVFANGTAKGGGGIVLGDSNNTAYNNLIYGNFYWAFMVIPKSSLTTNTHVYNNTLYNNPYGIWVQGSTTNTKVINNILYQSGVVGDNGTGTTISTNIVGNPAFNNAAGNDFRLQSGSVAIDSGITITSVTTDHVGTSRPKFAAYDIGAYEATGTLSAPTPPRNLTVR
jgi:parallel beta-helix repeat protein